VVSTLLCGLYFKWPFNQSSSSTSTDEAAGNTRMLTARKPIEVVCAMYSIMVLIVLWVNSIRILTVYTPKDHVFLTIIQKMLSVTWYLQPTLQHTAYFMASHSGKLDRILNNIQQLPQRKRQGVGRNAVILTICSWLAIAISVSFQIYGIQTTYNGSTAPSSIAPFGTYLQVTNTLLHQVIITIVTIHVHSSWIFPLTMTLMLTMTFTSHFRSVDKRLREAIKRPQGITDEVIDDTREEHQKLCRLVERSNHFLQIHYSAAFIIPLADIIGLLFVLLFHNLNFSSTLSRMLQTLYFLAIHMFQLGLTAYSGILVNHYVGTKRRPIFFI
jgi:hypothetical protein